MLSSPASQMSITRLHALGTAATARVVMGDLAGAAPHAEQALALESRLGAPALIARRALSGIAYLRGDVHEALRLTQDLARRARAAGDEPLACETDGFIVQVLHAAGDARAAAALAGEMRARADGLRSPILVSWSRYASGIIALASEPATARRWLTDSLALARTIGYHQMVSLNLRGLGVAALLEGEHNEAAERLLEALAYDEARANPSTQWGTLMAFAPLLAARGGDEPAAALLAATERLPAAPLLASLALVGTLAHTTREQLAARMPPQRLATATAHGRTLDLAAARALARAELTALTGRPAQPPPSPSR